jgi:hypothetical protein
MSQSACVHAEIVHGSGGYYLMCRGCGQTWVARRIGADSDTDLDRGPPRTCTTPLAFQSGRYVWTGAAP